ncbi:MAG: polysaccharide biosynthesis protein [Spirochaetae bacterium HGW-Spirochaetae-2]|jgi:O-antigen/teichoic acid export membrane protein|nr:MAG: polysaccharide biosynthesis protein [Spirochaetae bacterium HGW-Spirochaetae-2]
MSKTHNRFRLLIENFFAYGLINVLNKIIPLLLLPVITRLLTDPADFGRFDMFNTLVSFGSALAGLGMYDAMFREFFEKNDPLYKKQVTSSALSIVLCSSIIIASILILFKKPLSMLVLGGDKYQLIVVFAAVGVIFHALQSIIAAPTRMQNKRKIYIYSGLMNSGIYYAFAIILIYYGYRYYGLIYSNLISIFLLILFFYLLNRAHFSLHDSNRSIRSELLRIGIPLVPTFIIYWVFHSMDRIMISNMLGMDQVGIYSIGARVASISQFIYAAFAGGWQYFAFSTMKDSDQVSLNSRVFEILGIISILTLFGISFFDDFIFNTLFTGEYTKGVIVFPYLFISPLLLMLFQVAGNQFLVVKKSYIITGSLLVGASLNILLNFILIKIYGVKGAALSTLLGYFISLLIIMIVTKKQLLMVYSKKLILSVVFALLFLGLQFFNFATVSSVASILFVLLILVLYRKDLIQIVWNMRRKS